MANEAISGAKKRNSWSIALKTLLPGLKSLRVSFRVELYNQWQSSVSEAGGFVGDARPLPIGCRGGRGASGSPKTPRRLPSVSPRIGSGLPDATALPGQVLYCRVKRWPCRDRHGLRSEGLASRSRVTRSFQLVLVFCWMPGQWPVPVSQLAFRVWPACCQALHPPCRLGQQAEQRQ